MGPRPRALQHWLRGPAPDGQQGAWPLHLVRGADRHRPDPLDSWATATTDLSSLTLRGTTRPVTLTVEVNGFGPDPFRGTRAGFPATGEIDRTEYGTTFNAPVGGGVMVSEKIRIEIEAEAVLRKD